MKHNKFFTKKKRVKGIKIIGICLFYLLIVGILGSAIFVAVLLITNLANNSEQQYKIQIMVGLGTSLLSLAIGITGLATFATTSFKNTKKDKKERIEKTNDFIKEFNDCIIVDLNIVTRILRILYGSIGWENKFLPQLSDQKEVYEEFNGFLNDKKITYKEKLLFSAASVLFLENGVASQQLTDYCGSLIEEKSKGKAITINTYGAIQTLHIFKRKRIAILNYFENLAICYINEMVDVDLVNEQFKGVLKSIIPMFYYEIYRLEKLSSYPYLNKMLKIMLNE